MLVDLSVCRGFDLDTAHAVTLRDDAGDSLHRLLDASLVVRVDDERFRLLEPVRQLAEQQLLASGNPAEVRERLAAHMVDVTRRMARRADFDVEARQALRHELGNVEQALHHLIVTGNDTDAVTMYGSIGPSWFSDYAGPTMERWTPQIRRLVDQQDPAVAAPARLVMGMAAEGTGERGALSDLRAALEGFLSANRAQGAASAAFWLARELALDGSDHQTTVEAFETARTSAIVAGHDVLHSWCGIWLGHLAALRRRPDSRRGGTARGDQSEPALRTQSPDREAVGVLAESPGVAATSTSAANYSTGRCRMPRSDDYFQLTAQLRRRIRYNSDTRYHLEQAAADLAECARLVLLRGPERVIVETLCAATHYLDASGCHTLARSTRASIAAWPANEKGLTNTVTEALGHQQGELVDEYLNDGLTPLAPGPQLRAVLQHIAQESALQT